MIRVRHLRLTCDQLWVNARLARINGRWIASADTPDGPTLACAFSASDALAEALRPFDGLVEELLGSLPDYVLQG
jgi:hypothetical protein